VFVGTGVYDVVVVVTVDVAVGTAVTTTSVETMTKVTCLWID
jgi:hypothetical protein